MIGSLAALASLPLVGSALGSVGAGMLASLVPLGSALALGTLF
ncbi:hypothetical protein [Nocardia brasiliensis]|nr:hypothetical protein [Nocardia brasiliensis]SUB40400.1 Uncharacterised protein [Nocardia brasiliensis]